MMNSSPVRIATEENIWVHTANNPKTRTHCQSYPSSPAAWRSPFSPFFNNIRVLRTPWDPRNTPPIKPDPRLSNALDDNFYNGRSQLISFSKGTRSATYSAGKHTGQTQRIVVFVDATKALNTDALIWALDRVANARDSVTFVGVLPWLTIPLGVRRWAQLRTIDENSCTTATGDIQFKSDEFCKIQQAYREKGVSLNIKIKSGFPHRRVAVQIAQELNPKWVIFYRELTGMNIVFLKSKEEGSMSFASYTSLIAAPNNHDYAPGFGSPHLLNPTSDHVGLQDLLKNITV